jgi:hypothetical protein
MLLVPVPWSRRRWALPFLAFPTFTPAISVKLGKPHRTAPERTEGLIRLIRRWQPQRTIEVVGDSSFAVLRLAHACGAIRVRLISRLVLNAQLYDPPPVRPASTPGVKPKKGPRQPKLCDRLDVTTVAAGHTAWERQVVAWYGHQQRLLDVATGTALWHTDGCDPLPIRWVLLRDPQGRLSPYALFCTDQEVDATAILAAYLQRWNVEVTFEEARAHLGLETQRQWTTRAVGRTTPCLLGLFSVVVLMAHAAHPAPSPNPPSAMRSPPSADTSGPPGPTGMRQPRPAPHRWPIRQPTSSVSWWTPPATRPETAKVESKMRESRDFFRSFARAVRPSGGSQSGGEKRRVRPPVFNL